jgi:hypothetical protein
MANLDSDWFLTCSPATACVSFIFVPDLVKIKHTIEAAQEANYFP